MVTVRLAQRGGHTRPVEQVLDLPNTSGLARGSLGPNDLPLVGELAAEHDNSAIGITADSLRWGSCGL